MMGDIIMNYTDTGPIGANVNMNPDVHHYGSKEGNRHDRRKAKAQLPRRDRKHA
jgi:hypothetical protein